MKSKLDEEEHARLMEENRLENEKTAQLREERLKIEAVKTQERVMTTLIKKEQENKIFEAQVDTFLQQQKVNCVENCLGFFRLKFNLYIVL